MFLMNVAQQIVKQELVMVLVRVDIIQAGSRIVLVGMSVVLMGFVPILFGLVGLVQG